MEPHDWLPGDPWYASRDSLIPDYYDLLTAFVRERHITSVVEIGIRAGYSMLAMMRGAKDLTYLGIDTFTGDGSLPGGQAHAEMLLQHYSTGIAEIWPVDSQTLTELPQRYDLAYIDGNHSFLTCLHDLELCGNYCDLILCDDYLFFESVRRAVDQFCETYRIPMTVVNSWRGWAVLDMMRMGEAEVPLREVFRGTYYYPHEQPSWHPVLNLLTHGPVDVPEALRAVAEACVQGGTLIRVPIETKRNVHDESPG